MAEATRPAAPRAPSPGSRTRQAPGRPGRGYGSAVRAAGRPLGVALSSDNSVACPRPRTVPRPRRPCAASSSPSAIPAPTTTDTGGRAIVELLTAAGHIVEGRRIVRDEPAEVAALVALSRPQRSMSTSSSRPAAPASRGATARSRPSTGCSRSGCPASASCSACSASRRSARPRCSAAPAPGRAAARSSSRCPDRRTPSAWRMTRLLIPELGHLVAETTPMTMRPFTSTISITEARAIIEAGMPLIERTRARAAARGARPRARRRRGGHRRRAALRPRQHGRLRGHRRRHHRRDARAPARVAPGRTRLHRRRADGAGRARRVHRDRDRRADAGGRRRRDHGGGDGTRGDATSSSSRAVQPRTERRPARRGHRHRTDRAARRARC